MIATLNSSEIHRFITVVVYFFSFCSCSESNDSLNDVKSCKNTFESIGPFEMSGESDNLKNDLCIGEKIYEFYRAPITKFWGNVVSATSK